MEKVVALAICVPLPWTISLGAAQSYQQRLFERLPPKISLWMLVAIATAVPAHSTAQGRESHPPMTADLTFRRCSGLLFWRLYQLARLSKPFRLLVCGILSREQTPPRGRWPDRTRWKARNCKANSAHSVCDCFQPGEGIKKVNKARAVLQFALWDPRPELDSRAVGTPSVHPAPLSSSTLWWPKVGACSCQAKPAGPHVAGFPERSQDCSDAHHRWFFEGRCPRDRPSFRPSFIADFFWVSYVLILVSHPEQKIFIYIHPETKE